jgi:hypothetical protein
MLQVLLSQNSIYILCICIIIKEVQMPYCHGAILFCHILANSEKCDKKPKTAYFAMKNAIKSLKRLAFFIILSYFKHFWGKYNNTLRTKRKSFTKKEPCLVVMHLGKHLAWKVDSHVKSPQKSKSQVKTAKNYFKTLKIIFSFDFPRKNVLLILPCFGQINACIVLFKTYGTWDQSMWFLNI